MVEENKEASQGSIVHISHFLDIAIDINTSYIKLY